MRKLGTMALGIAAFFAFSAGAFGMGECGWDAHKSAATTQQITSTTTGTGTGTKPVPPAATKKTGG